MSKFFLTMTGFFIFTLFAGCEDVEYENDVVAKLCHESEENIQEHEDITAYHYFSGVTKCYDTKGAVMYGVYEGDGYASITRYYNLEGEEVAKMSSGDLPFGDPIEGELAFCKYIEFDNPEKEMLCSRIKCEDEIDLCMEPG